MPPKKGAKKGAKKGTKTAVSLNELDDIKSLNIKEREILIQLYQRMKDL